MGTDVLNPTQTNKQTDTLKNLYNALDIFSEYISAILDDVTLFTGDVVFLKQTREMFSKLKEHIQNSNVTDSILIGRISHVISISAETIRISVLSALCRQFTEHYTLQSSYIDSLNVLTSEIIWLQKSVLKIQNLVEQYLLPPKCNGIEWTEVSMAYTVITDVTNGMCVDCAHRLAPIERRIRTLLHQDLKHVTVCRVVSCSVAVICAGRMLYNMFKNGPTQPCIQTGLWAVCGGVTAAMTVIPGKRARQLAELFTTHRDINKHMLKMVQTT